MPFIEIPMKLYELQAIVHYLHRFQTLRRVERVDDTTLVLHFDEKVSIGFDLRKGNTDIFDASGLTPVRSYQAPFDTVLARRLNGASLVDVSLHGGDRILRLTTRKQGAYKAPTTLLQLEFTGRHTNAILLDEEETVLEALRHIDREASFRIVRPGVKLAPLPPYTGRRASGSVEDLPAWLRIRRTARDERQLQQLQARHAGRLRQKIARLQQKLEALPDRRKLQEKAARYDHYGAIVLAHLHTIAPYDTLLETVDFEGNPIRIDLPSLPNPKRMGEHFYTLAKKARAKAENLHIEEENLRGRILFYERLLENVITAKRAETIRLLFPGRESKKAASHAPHCEIFRLEGCLLWVGRNEKENEWVLKHAKADDMWFHLKDRPSAHCILRCDGKRQIPKSRILEAAHICVETSTTQPDLYLVDYTRRRHIKIVHGAHVRYTDYDTVAIRKGK